MAEQEIERLTEAERRVLDFVGRHGRCTYVGARTSERRAATALIAKGLLSGRSYHYVEPCEAGRAALAAQEGRKGSASV